jgi:hypothetical protein
VPQSRGWATDAATTDGLPTDQPPTNDAQIDAATARALASTLRFPGRPTDETTVLPAISARNTRDAETVVLPRSNAAGSDASAAAKRPSWKEQLPGWKSVAVVTALSFVVGTGAMAGVELLRGHGVIGTNGSVFSNGGGGKQEQHPSPMTPGGHGSGGTGSSPSTPSTPTPSGATTPSQTPSTTPSTPSTDTPSTTPSTDPTTPSTTPDTTPAPPTGTDAPSNPGNANSSAPAAGKPSGTTAPVS